MQLNEKVQISINQQGTEKWKRKIDKLLDIEYLRIYNLPISNNKANVLASMISSFCNLTGELDRKTRKDLPESILTRINRRLSTL